MNLLSKIFSWKANIVVTVLVLMTLIILNFYSLYTGIFYFSKPGSYILPLLTVVHCLYLYVIWFKITEGEYPDPIMRNLEYFVYAILIFYVFKIYDAYVILSTIPKNQGYLIPSNSVSIGTIALAFHIVLPLLTLGLFWSRKKYVGIYNFENYNSNLNMWQ